MGGRAFRFVRLYKGVRRFPTGPVREWWIVDLFENLELAGLARDDAVAQLSAALAAGRFNREVLVDPAARWATPRRKREARSRDEPTEQPGAMHAEREHDLAAGGAGRNWQRATRSP